MCKLAPALRPRLLAMCSRCCQPWSGRMKQRLLNVLIALDQLAYELVTLGAGSPDETLSAAAWRTEQKGRLLGRIFRPLID